MFQCECVVCEWDADNVNKARVPFWGEPQQSLVEIALFTFKNIPTYHTLEIKVQ